MPPTWSSVFRHPPCRCFFAAGAFSAGRRALAAAPLSAALAAGLAGDLIGGTEDVRTPPYPHQESTRTRRVTTNAGSGIAAPRGLRHQAQHVDVREQRCRRIRGSLYSI